MGSIDALPQESHVFSRLILAVSALFRLQEHHVTGPVAA
jgi:hypothetical protein